MSEDKQDQDFEGAIQPYFSEHRDNGWPVEPDAILYKDACQEEYARWLLSIARVYAEQEHPDDKQVLKDDLVNARAAILTWIGMAMGEMVVSGDDTFLQQFRAFNSHAPGPFQDEYPDDPFESTDK